MLSIPLRVWFLVWYVFLLIVIESKSSALLRADLKLQSCNSAHNHLWLAVRLAFCEHRNQVTTARQETCCTVMATYTRVHFRTRTWICKLCFLYWFVWGVNYLVLHSCSPLFSSLSTSPCAAAFGIAPELKGWTISLKMFELEADVVDEGKLFSLWVKHTKQEQRDPLDLCR